MANVSGSAKSRSSVMGFAQVPGIGTSFHDKLKNRDKPDQHPMSAISGLLQALSSIPMDSVAGLLALLSTKVDDMEVTEDGLVYLLSGGERISGPHGPFAGSGGGGSANNAVLTMANTTGWLFKNIAQNVKCLIKFTWSSLEDGISTGMGAVSVKVGGLQRYSASVNQGAVEIDIRPYLASGSNSVRVSISDAYGNSRTLSFTINVEALTLTANFDATAAYSGDIIFPYTPTGAVEKTVHFVLDGVEIDTATVAESGRQQTFTIPAQNHGSHPFFAYFSAEIDGEAISSNGLYYDIICTEAGNTTPIIASAYQNATAEQFVALSIPFIVYDPANITTAISLLANGEEVNALTVGRTQQLWTYRPDDAGALELVIKCGVTTKVFNITVAEATIDVSATTNDLSLYLASYGRSNAEEEPAVWTSGDVAASMTGFNFVADGWQNDEDGNVVLRVSGDARVEIPLQIFATDFRGTGKTIEIEFTTRDVMDYDAVILSCFSGGRGIQMTSQMAMLKSEQSEISTMFKEGEHVRLTFVVEKRSENRLILCYINGVMCGAVQYPSDDDFSQASPVNISIGSSESTIDLYGIRVYENDLTRFQILNNWIADTQDGLLRKERYQHNNVFDAYGQIVISQLPDDLPYMIITCEELPQSKGDKKTVMIEYVDPLDATKSFVATGVQIDVQGTSSQYYARKNYKIKLKNGLIINGTLADLYQLRANSIPTDVFTLKADVASSEGANNVELVRLYDEACPYRTPPQEEDERVRQGIDGFPMVVFWDNGSTTTFLGKYNFNNDKGTPEVFGLGDDDQSWETLNNTSNRVIWKSADFSGTDWTNDFEARHPEGNADVEDLAALAEWLVSTDQTAATDVAFETAVTYDGVEYTSDTAAYRLAKFKAELPEHMELDSALFYYLFTELFLMVDSRAKNSFPTLYAGDKWCWLPYDMDTAIGINNEGALVFGYSLEDIDKVNGADVYNGQESVIWKNIREAFYSELTAMYQKLRADKALTYALVEGRFEEHQAKWPEAIFNEDAYFKYLQPLIDDGDGAYLSMLQGSKAEQRKWWLYNRFRYMDAKYNAGDALTDVITLRGYAKASVTVTPYADIYAAIKYGSYLTQMRALRGSSYTLECPLDEVNDTEIYIYSASQLKDIGDLSGLHVGYANFSYGTKLQALKIGDASESYSNGNLTELVLGNNTLLRTLDVRNCPNLTMAVDVSGCTNLKAAYFDGTSVTGIGLAPGSTIKTLRLPATVANLTLRNQMNLETFYMPSYANITTLWVENPTSAVNVPEIVLAMAANSRVRIIGADWTLNSVELMDRLIGMRGLTETGDNVDDAVVSGTVHFAFELPVSKLVEFQVKFPYVTFTYDSLNQDILVDADGAAILDADGAVIVTSDGGYTSRYSAATIDEFIAVVQTQMEAFNNASESE